MKPAPFDYHAPTTLAEALALLDEYGFDAKLLAGGQSLVPTMNFRLALPEILIDINHIADLAFVRNEDDGLHIGALTRHAELERSELVAEKAPLLAEAMPNVAHSQIRNRGTIGGSLAHADPAAELPAIMIALEARFRIQSQSDDRWIAASDFFVDLFTTELEAEEILTEIVIPPLPARTGCAFLELARRHGDFALVGAATRVTLDNLGACSEARIVLLSVGNTSVRAVLAEQSLQGKALTGQNIRDAALIASDQDIEPPADMHATEKYRRQLTKVLAERTLTKALERATSAP